MPIITISRGAYSRGKEVAEKVAERLGYDCIAREVLLEASQKFNIPEIRLLQDIHDAHASLERFLYGKEEYLTYIQSTLLRIVQKDNVVYHGFGDHFFFKDVGHVLKVLILADIQDRVKLVMEREGIVRQSLRYVKTIDEERRKWGRLLYGADIFDPRLYDLILHIKKVTVDDAVDIICHTAKLKNFQATPESQRALADLVLAAEVKAALIHTRRDLEVSSEEGKVFVRIRAPEAEEEEVIAQIQEIASGVSGVSEVRVRVIPSGLGG
ncbi:MAG: cytidylate kinase family protein [Thermodesulfobacteriota bacterium]